METIDARGLSCPEPVLRARRAVQASDAGTELVVLVESVTSRENVRRTAASMGCTVSIEDHDRGFRLLIKKA